ncbi:hypothetical protein ACTFIR_003957 [Dictyostelium discoideum]
MLLLFEILKLYLLYVKLYKDSDWLREEISMSETGEFDEMYLVKFKGCQKLGWTKEVDTYFEELVKRVSEYRQYQVCKRYQQPCSEEQEVNLPVGGRLFHYKQVWKELNIQNFCKANNSIKHIAKSSRNAFAVN